MRCTSPSPRGADISAVENSISFSEPRRTSFFVEAFKDLVDALVTEREERLDVLRDEISAALGAEGRVITNVLPNLENNPGPQPPIPEVGGAETLNRFNYLFRKFVRALCTAAHPVVIFVDDMQWADSASLQPSARAHDRSGVRPFHARLRLS